MNVTAPKKLLKMRQEKIARNDSGTLNPDDDLLSRHRGHAAGTSQTPPSVQFMCHSTMERSSSKKTVLESHLRQVRMVKVRWILYQDESLCRAILHSTTIFQCIYNCIPVYLQLYSSVFTTVFHCIYNGVPMHIPGLFRTKLNNLHWLCSITACRQIRVKLLFFLHHSKREDLIQG